MTITSKLLGKKGVIDTLRIVLLINRCDNISEVGTVGPIGVSLYLLVF